MPKIMAEDIFISYSRKDSYRVMPIVKELREAGYSVWLDDTNIESAALWAEQIVEGLKNCKLLMLMASEDSLASANVLKEVMLASELEKIILPVYLEECTLPSRFQYQLAGIQHIDLFSENDKTTLELLTDSLDKTDIIKLSDDLDNTKRSSKNRSHRLILNYSKYIYSSIIGAIIILYTTIIGLETAGASLTQNIHLAEIIQVVGITMGALIFSYRSSAFKPWLVPYGIGVPEEEEIINKYIQITDSAVFYAIVSAIASTLMGLINAIRYFSTDVFIHIIGAAISALTFSFGLLLLIVIPTRFKLQSLLSDKKVFEAEERERKKRFELIKKDWAKDFNRGENKTESNANIKDIKINKQKIKKPSKILSFFINNNPHSAINSLTKFVIICIASLFSLMFILIFAAATYFEFLGFGHSPDRIDKFLIEQDKGIAVNLNHDPNILVNSKIEYTLEVRGTFDETFLARDELKQLMIKIGLRTFLRNYFSDITKNSLFLEEDIQNDLQRLINKKLHTEYLIMTDPDFRDNDFNRILEHTTDPANIIKDLKLVDYYVTYMPIIDSENKLAKFQKDDNIYNSKINNEVLNSQTNSNERLIPYDLGDSTQLWTQDNIFLNAKVVFLIKPKTTTDDNKDLITDFVMQIRSKLVDAARSYLVSIPENKVNLKDLHKSQLKNRLNDAFNEALQDNDEIRRILSTNPVESVLIPTFRSQ